MPVTVTDHHFGHIDNCAEQLLQIAEMLKDEVRFVSFNGDDVIARPGETVDLIVRRWSAVRSSRQSQ